MPAITALRPTRREGRISVHVDGEFLFAVSGAFVARQGLFVGRELHEAELGTLVAEAGRDQALTDAYRLLSHRSRSRFELADRLRAKGHDAAAVDLVLERLGGEGLIDDQAFAAAFVADKRRLAGWGSVRIERELAKLGVETRVVDAALAASGCDAGDLAERERAVAALRRRGPAAPPLDRARKRAFEFLVRRGYTTTDAYGAVRAWIDESAPPD